MANISDWSKDVPSSTSSVSETDDLLRSHWSILESAIEEEHFFKENSGISTGVHKLGSGKVHVGPYSHVSSANDPSRLMIDSDYSRFWYVGSEDTIELGGSQAGNVAGLVEAGNPSASKVIVFNSARTTVGADSSPGFTAEPAGGVVKFFYSIATVVNEFRSFRIDTASGDVVNMKSRNSVAGNAQTHSDIDYIMVVEIAASKVS